MQSYEYIAVLCPSALNKRDKFDERAPDGSYLGGQIRMQAAAYLYSRAKANSCKIIVIGGGVKKSDELEKWKKVKDMRLFLEKNNVRREDIICIVSEENTLGNLRALWKVYGSQLRGRNIGILSNSYHLPRVLRIAKDAQFDWGANISAISAEEVVGAPFSFRAKTDVMKRIILESKGLNDWDRGEYVAQNESQTNWQGELLAI